MQFFGDVIDKTFRSWKFWAFLMLAVMMTYVLFFPFFAPLIRDYSELNTLKEKMFEENDAIICYRIYSMDPEIFEKVNTSCPGKYYRPGTPTMEYGGLTVYSDTYQEFLRIRERTMEDIHRAIPFLLIVALVSIYFNYVLVGVAYRSANGEQVIIKNELVRGINSLPSLLVAELMVLFAVFLLGVTVGALLFAVFRGFGMILVSFLMLPVTSLVAPAYYLTGNIIPLGEIFNAIRNNPAGYLVLALVITILNSAFKAIYSNYIPLWSLLLLAGLGLMKFLVDSVGGLTVYLGGTEEEKG